MSQKHLGKIAVLIIAVFLFTSCASLPPPGTALTPEERENARKTCIAQYTAAGAIGGAIIGGLLGGKKTKVEGALIGAAAGGALAFAIAWGHCLSVYSDLNSYPVADSRVTAERIGYAPSQGTVAKIEDFYLDPEGVAPGGKVKLNGSYYVMAPEGNREVKVTETRTVHYFDPSENQWKELGAVSQDVTAALGTRRAEGSFDMPPDVPEGKYRISFRISSQGREDEVMRDLTVKKGLAMGPRNQPRPSQTQVASAPRADSSNGAKSVAAAPDGKAAKAKERMIIVTGKKINVRKGPSGKADVIAVVKDGEVYPVVQSSSAADGTWHMIRLDDGKEGWVPGKYVKMRE